MEHEMCPMCQDTPTEGELCENCAWLDSIENSPDSRIATCRRILDHGFEKIDGYLVDVQTANLLVQVYAKLSPKHRRLFQTAPLDRVVDAAWKAVAK